MLAGMVFFPGLLLSWCPFFVVAAVWCFAQFAGSRGVRGNTKKKPSLVESVRRCRDSGAKWFKCDTRGVIREMEAIKNARSGAHPRQLSTSWLTGWNKVRCSHTLSHRMSNCNCHLAMAVFAIHPEHIVINHLSDIWSTGVLFWSVCVQSKRLTLRTCLRGHREKSHKSQTRRVSTYFERGREKKPIG